MRPPARFVFSPWSTDRGPEDVTARAGSPTEVAAKLAISEVLHQYCRAMDRMDAELALACWHDGGTDDHGPLYTGTAAGFVEWLWPVHAEMVLTRHMVSNTLIHVDGQRAGSECYVNVVLRVERDGQLIDILGGGRYLDTFECIDGVWAIRHRQYVSEWNRVEPVVSTQAMFADRPLIEQHNPERPRNPPARDLTDPSYAVLR